MSAMKKTRRILILTLLLLTSFANHVFGQDSIEINEIRTDLDGKTKRGVLLKELGLESGQQYESLEDLEIFIQFHVNNLLRRRLFKSFEWNILPAGEGLVDIQIQLEDSVTLIPRPILKYSTARGLTFGLKADYYNAFGTLTDHMVQGYWSPIELLFEYNVDNIIVGKFHLGMNIKQFDGTTRYGNIDGNTVAEYRSTYSQLSGSLDIPLASISPWTYTVTPLLSWQYNHRMISNETSYPDEVFRNYGFSPGLNHGFVLDDVDWVGNFRKGLYFDMMNYNLWYTGSGTSDLFLESDLKGFIPLTSWFEISGRISGFYSFTGPRDNAGDRLRGVVDYMTYGAWGNYLSLQTNFKVFETPRGLALHLRPFTDIGYVYSEYWGNGPDAWEYCVGSTIIVFFKALPSLNLNIDCGWDLKRNMPELIIETISFY
ncbi:MULTISPECIES: hypothetical protein [unclassified Oceanispirochaeta]|uniref:hypothetical protein n=1 Tax=unclassified Oceanispirochaeta TaxID=2635722 RepID=UPI000E091E88|nr:MULTISPECIES: hypothetical protein [unclassified Oceanispirochaeta]MBF9017264.1 hypothetical protein [Oceanispirochaeta sp. M2]NPD75371.1 hypothetical protein [Oceanispirochaeta sp. M1]RDG28775.1 hypothetical protein DV872_25070 [Oceanispirochaeta sp. M1]